MAGRPPAPRAPNGADQVLRGTRAAMGAPTGPGGCTLERLGGRGGSGWSLGACKPPRGLTELQGWQVASSGGVLGDWRLPARSAGLECSGRGKQCSPRPDSAPQQPSGRLQIFPAALQAGSASRLWMANGTEQQPLLLYPPLPVRVCHDHQTHCSRVPSLSPSPRRPRCALRAPCSPPPPPPPSPPTAAAARAIHRGFDGEAVFQRCMKES